MNQEQEKTMHLIQIVHQELYEIICLLQKTELIHTAKLAEDTYILFEYELRNWLKQTDQSKYLNKKIS